MDDGYRGRVGRGGGGETEMKMLRRRRSGINGGEAVLRG